MKTHSGKLVVSCLQRIRLIEREKKKRKRKLGTSFSLILYLAEELCTEGCICDDLLNIGR